MHSRAVFFERLQATVVRFLAVLVAAFAAVAVRHGLRAPWDTYRVPAALAAAVIAILMWRRRSTPGGRRFTEAVTGVSIGTVILLVLSFFYRAESYSRLTVAVFFPLAVGAVWIADAIHLRLLRIAHGNPASVRAVLVVGASPAAVAVGEALCRDPAYFRLVGYVEDPFQGGGTIAGVDVVGRSDELGQLIDSLEVDEVVLVLPGASDSYVLDLLGECMRRRVSWKTALPMFGLLPERVSVEIIGGVPFAGRMGSRLVGYDWYLKRLIDVAVAGAALVVALPVMAVVAVLVKLTSPGPVLFRQERIGLGGRPFEFLKFRSMFVHADPETHRDYTDGWIEGSAPAVGSIHKIHRDRRVTPVGRVIRAASIDELPQLWNVLRGDMSVVGPRPPIPYEVERYTEWHKRRLEVPPGVTGLWQVSGRNRLTFEEMVTLDVEYVDHWSPRRDIAILARTVPAVLWDRGR